jgi:hypothetical protein
MTCRKATNEACANKANVNKWLKDIYERRILFMSWCFRKLLFCQRAAISLQMSRCDEHVTPSVRCSTCKVWPWLQVIQPPYVTKRCRTTPEKLTLTHSWNFLPFHYCRYRSPPLDPEQVQYFSHTQPYLGTTLIYANVSCMTAEQI